MFRIEEAFFHFCSESVVFFFFLLNMKMLYMRIIWVYVIVAMLWKWMKKFKIAKPTNRNKSIDIFSRQIECKITS